MKLARFVYQGRPGFGIVESDTVIPRETEGLRHFADLLSASRAASNSAGSAIPLADIDFLPPIPPAARIFCVGRNFKRAMARAGLEHPAHPILFTRFPASLVGHLAPIVRPAVSEQLDYEGELAVVIGRSGRHVDPAEALDFVGGYTCFNDGSVRDWQRHKFLAFRLGWALARHRGRGARLSRALN